MRAHSLNPIRVDIKQGSKEMTIEWEDQSLSRLSFETLRSHCACSYCRAGGNMGRVNILNNCHLSEAVAMGSSGLQLVFADGHDRGIYPWGYLHAIGEGRGMDYFNELE